MEPLYNRRVFTAERTPIETVKDRPVKKGKNSYKGCFYTVGFKVNRAVSLTGLKFFGPADGDASYEVKVMICRTEEVWTGWSRCFGYWFGGPWYNIVELMPTWTTRIFDCKKGQKFDVVFDRPVNIGPNLWTDIKFELIGPETECLQFGFGGTEVFLEDFSNVRFEFLAGSRQLPAVQFMTK